MVAKSYQGLKINDEPYILNGRQYVHVVTKSGSLKQVRWYSDAEYRKMYPEEAQMKQKIYRTQKQVLGFDNGYITIFKGNTYEDREYFKLNSARYNKFWGWYFISTEELPDDIPDDVEPIRLNWELVGNDNDTLKTDAEVTAAVESLIYDEDPSEYAGAVGDKIEVTVTVEKAIQLDGYYGPSQCYIMRDDKQNCFVWITTSKNTQLTVGNIYQLVGTIKNHQTYKGVKQTILTRCRCK